MIILGIHDGHNASAALIKDGQLVSAVAEERLSRRKHHYGFPFAAVNAVLAEANVKKADVDKVAMATKSLPPRYFLTSRNANFSIADYWKEQREYWYPKIYQNSHPSYLDLFKEHLNRAEFIYDSKLIKDEDDHKGMWQARLKLTCETLLKSESDIEAFDHHKCHAFYGHMFSPHAQNTDTLIYTMDGGGDGLNGTISIGKPDGYIETIMTTANCNIGRIYRYITLLLGMRPADHEYKLMGLAAYNNMANAKSAYEVFKQTLKVDGLDFGYTVPVKDHFFYFKDRLEGMRFDAIAFGLQKRTEELLCEWIENGVRATGIGHLVMSGGVSQNIKANKLIWELDAVKTLTIPPGPGDESISIGAAGCLLNSVGEKRKAVQIPNAYFGISYSSEAVNVSLESYKSSKDFQVQSFDLDVVADLLANGGILARFDPKSMEFGARALGNRSIIADPRNPQVIHSINKSVKMRDFWMPFAPSVLEERSDDYFRNPKGIEARFMAVGFDTTELGKEHLAAGLHPFDKSARPQIVTHIDNPDYYSLIKAFEKKTGVGAVLNTSFNIHGEPIVCTPDEALDTFFRCGLDHLILGDWIVSKRDD